MAAERKEDPAGRRRLTAVLQWAVTLGAAATILGLVDWHEVAAALARIGPAAMAVPLLLALASHALGAGRLALILDRLGIGLGLRRAVVFTWICLFAGNVLPTTIGGDALFAVLLARARFPVGSCVVGLVYNRVVNVAVVLLSVPVALAFVQVTAVPAASVPFFALAFAGLLLFLAALLWLGRDRLPALLERLQEVLREVAILVRQPGLALQTAALSFAMLGLGALATLVLARALVPDSSYAFIWGMLVLTLAVQTLPLSINGLGVQEATFTLCLTQAGGWPLAEAVSFSLLMRLLAILASLPGLPAMVWLGRGKPVP